jgi:predicted DNA binding CopG/RHH family protein
LFNPQHPSDIPVPPAHPVILSKICFRVANPARVIGAGYWRKQKKTYENQKTSYTAEPAEEGWDFDGARALDRGQQKAAGIPEPAAVGKMKVVRKPARPVRINIRTTHETIAGLRARAEEAGLPYQTLAASVLHMVAKGELKLYLARVG